MSLSLFALAVLAAGAEPEYVCIMKVDQLQGSLKEVYAAFKRSEGRRNGVLLQIDCLVDEKANPASFVINWQLDYNGPRPPLHILRPSIEYATDQTIVFLFIKATQDTLYRIKASSYLVPGIHEADEAWFVKVKKGKPIKGVIAIPVNQIQSALIKKFPDSLPWDKQLEVHVLVEHNPTERGLDYSLDAWTGFLQSNFATSAIPSRNKNQGPPPPKK